MYKCLCSVNCVAWDDGERKGEGETRRRLIACSSRKAPRGKLHDHYGKPDIMRIDKSRRMRWAGHVTRMGNERGAWKLLVGKPEGKRPVGRPRMRWKNSINHDLREIDYTGDDWKSLAEDREVWRAYVHAVMNLWVR